MGTRAIYNFRGKDDKKWYRVYSHWDNYPAGAYAKIENALRAAWPLPRFEADEFACAFIAANKNDAGDIRLLHPNVKDVGQDYEYFITCTGSGDAIEKEPAYLWIQFDDVREDGETLFTWKGTLEEMKEYIREKE